MLLPIGKPIDTNDRNTYYSLMNKTPTQIAAEKLVRYFNNSQTETAIALEVSQPTVNGWVNGKHNISAKVAFRAEAVTKRAFRACDLCFYLSDTAA